MCLDIGMQNLHEELARERKAQRLADALDAVGVLPVDAAVFTTEQRGLVADHAGTHPPSAETWDLACTKLAARYDLRARLRRTA